jgi:hypothetical protein
VFNIKDHPITVYFAAFLAGLTIGISIIEYTHVKILETRLQTIQNELENSRREFDKFVKQMDTQTGNRIPKQNSQQNSVSTLIKNKQPQQALGYKIILNYNLNDESSFSSANSIKAKLETIGYEGRIELKLIEKFEYGKIGIFSNNGEIVIYYDKLQQAEAGNKLLSTIKTNFPNKKVTCVATVFDHPELDHVNIYIL